MMIKSHGPPLRQRLCHLPRGLTSDRRRGSPARQVQVHHAWCACRTKGRHSANRRLIGHYQSFIAPDYISRGVVLGGFQIQRRARAQQHARDTVSVLKRLPAYPLARPPLATCPGESLTSPIATSVSVAVPPESVALIAVLLVALSPASTASHVPLAAALALPTTVPPTCTHGAYTHGVHDGVS